GFYLQDRWWTPARWLTVVPGLRFDYGRTNDRHGRVVSSLFGIGPRLALVADLTRDSKTVPSAPYGRSNDVISLLPAANFDGMTAGNDVTRQGDPAPHRAPAVWG